jgi:hypothetical protein
MQFKGSCVFYVRTLISLHVRGARSVTYGEEHALKAFENGVLKTIFEPGMQRTRTEFLVISYEI